MTLIITIAPRLAGKSNYATSLGFQEISTEASTALYRKVNTWVAIHHWLNVELNADSLSAGCPIVEQVQILKTLNITKNSELALLTLLFNRLIDLDSFEKRIQHVVNFEKGHNDCEVYVSAVRSVYNALSHSHIFSETIDLMNALEAEEAIKRGNCYF